MVDSATSWALESCGEIIHTAQAMRGNQYVNNLALCTTRYLRGLEGLRAPDVIVNEKNTEYHGNGPLIVKSKVPYDRLNLN